MVFQSGWDFPPISPSLHLASPRLADSAIDQLTAKKLNSSRHVAMAKDFFFNNANGPSNHHTKFENFPVYYGLYKNLQIKRFFIGFVLWLECSAIDYRDYVYGIGNG